MTVDATVEQAPTIQAALAAVMADVTHVGKEGKNSAQGYAFRGIDGVLNAVGPALRRRGVVVMPHLEAVEHLVVAPCSGERSPILKVRWSSTPACKMG